MVMCGAPVREKGQRIGIRATGKVGMVRMLIDRGADVNFAGSNGAAALYLAAQSGHKPLLELLLDGRGEAASHQCTRGSPGT